MACLDPSLALVHLCKNIIYFPSLHKLTKWYGTEGLKSKIESKILQHYHKIKLVATVATCSTF